MLNDWMAIFVLALLFIIFFSDAISSSSREQDEVSKEVLNMIEEGQ